MARAAAVPARIEPESGADTNDRYLWREISVERDGMKLILSDRPLPIDCDRLGRADVTYIDLSALQIANCTGCFGCWTRTPGRCVIRDDAVAVYPLIAASDTLLYVSRIRYGGYDTIMKTMLERAIPVQQAFIRLVDGETHHVQRAVAPKKATIIGYGDTGADERDVFQKLVARNARNMNFESYRVVFTTEPELEQTVAYEVEKWAASSF